MGLTAVIQTGLTGPRLFWTRQSGRFPRRDRFDFHLAHCMHHIWGDIFAGNLRHDQPLNVGGDCATSPFVNVVVATLPKRAYVGHEGVNPYNLRHGASSQGVRRKHLHPNTWQSRIMEERVCFRGRKIHEVQIKRHVEWLQDDKEPR